MDIRDRGALKEYTGQALAVAPYAPRKLALLHTGAGLLAGLALTVINFLLTRQIDSMAGLGSLGTRSILETAQSVLQLLLTFALPFWEIGFLYAAIQMARKNAAKPASLLEGFRRFFPLLRLFFLRAALIFGILMLSAQIASTIFMMTPLAARYYEIYDTLMANAASPYDIAGQLDTATMASLMEAMLPVFPMTLILSSIVLIPVLFRFRLAEYIMMDQPGTGAFASVRASNRMMRGNCMAMFRLDLSFWWFYLLQIVVTAIGYGDSLLSAFGVPLPFSQDAAFFLFYLAHIGCQLALCWWARSTVETTYAAAYDVLNQTQPIQPPAPQQPWTY